MGCSLLVAAGLALGALLAPATARGEEVSSDALGRAEALFAEGAKLLDAGAVGEACPKLEAAVTLTRRAALGGMLSLAECYERAGKLASAWGLYNEIAGKAGLAGQRERAEGALASAAALEPRVPHLLLEIPREIADLAGATVLINGLEQPRAGLGGPIPVDAGVVVLEVRAPLHEPARREISVDAGEREVRAALPTPRALDPEPDAPRPPGSPIGSSDGGSFWSTGRFAGLGVGSVGVAAAVGGLVVGGVAASAYDAGLAEGGCVGAPPVCDDTGPIDAARSLGDVATGLLFGGLGVATAGVLVFALAPDDDGPAVVSLHAGPRGATVEVSLW